LGHNKAGGEIHRLFISGTRKVAQALLGAHFFLCADILLYR